MRKGNAMLFLKNKFFPQSILIFVSSVTCSMLWAAAGDIEGVDLQETVISITEDSFDSNGYFSFRYGRPTDDKYDVKITNCGTSGSGDIKYRAEYRPYMTPMDPSNYVKLNEYIAVRTTVFIGQKSIPAYIPFDNKSNNERYSCGTYRGGLNTGKHVLVEVKKLKPFVNGINIKDTIDFKLGGNFKGQSSVKIDPPYTLFYGKIQFNVLKSQETCEINDNQVIEFDFDIVKENQIKSNSIPPLNKVIPIKCKGGDFDKPGSDPYNLYYQLNSDSVHSDNRIVKAKNTATGSDNNVGVVFKGNGQELMIGQPNDFMLNASTKEYNINLEAALTAVDSNAEITAGDFKANATLIVEFK